MLAQQKCNRFGLLGAQAARIFIDFIIQFAGNLLDFEAGLFIDQRAVTQGAGDGGLGHSGAEGNIKGCGFIVFQLVYPRCDSIFVVIVVLALIALRRRYYINPLFTYSEEGQTRDVGRFGRASGSQVPCADPLKIGERSCAKPVFAPLYYYCHVHSPNCP